LFCGYLAKLFGMKLIRFHQFDCDEIKFENDQYFKMKTFKVNSSILSEHLLSIDYRLRNIQNILNENQHKEDLKNKWHLASKVFDRLFFILVIIYSIIVVSVIILPEKNFYIF
jgi:hypothetical protein